MTSDSDSWEEERDESQNNQTSSLTCDPPPSATRRNQNQDQDPGPRDPKPTRTETFVGFVFPRVEPCSSSYCAVTVPPSSPPPKKKKTTTKQQQQQQTNRLKQGTRCHRFCWSRTRPSSPTSGRGHFRFDPHLCARDPRVHFNPRDAVPTCPRRHVTKHTK